MGRLVLYTAQRGQPLLSVEKSTFDGIEAYIRWAEAEVPRNIAIYMNDLVHRMALVNQAEARKMSYGPLDPSQQRPEEAWQIPVRRITERYYLGWKVRPIRDGWQLYNDSREAYYIEFGINWLGGGRRVRRPIRKLSLKKTLNYMASTQAYHRIWANMYRTRHQNAGFTQHVQSPGMGSFGGPGIGRFLP